MADKSISELVAATAVGSTDLFVLEQTGTAKKLTGQILENWLVSFADGHGGIQSITKTSTSGLVDTYTVLLADTTTYTFTVTNAKSISSITQYWAVSSSDTTVPSSWSTTRQQMTETDKYLWSYMTIAYNDSTSADTTKSVVGVYGDTGDASYVWIKYSSVVPSSDTDMGDDPDNYIGIYSGTASTAPTHYTDYTWFEWKGLTGDAAELDDQSVMYASSASGTTIPQSGWVDSPPQVAAGSYLWTRVILTFNTGSPVTYYTVARYGQNGMISTVNGVSPDGSGNVTITAGDIALSGSTMIDEIVLTTTSTIPIPAEGSSSSYSLNGITADHVVVRWGFSTSAENAPPCDLTITTYAGSFTVSNTSGSTSESIKPVFAIPIAVAAT